MKQESKVKLISSSSNDLLQDIAYMARVSNPSNQDNEETAEKLLKYLIKHKHWSPFEMCSITLEINTTRDIAHQIVRHRSFAFQEFSQRYAKPEDLGFPFKLRTGRLQDVKNRQNSIESKTRLYMHGTVRSWMHYIDVRTTHGTQKEHMDVARECAYVINPVFPMIKEFVHD